VAKFSRISGPPIARAVADWATNGSPAGPDAVQASARVIRRLAQGLRRGRLWGQGLPRREHRTVATARGELTRSQTATAHPVNNYMGSSNRSDAAMSALGKRTNFRPEAVR
jgi:hypothetical protein